MKTNFCIFLLVSFTTLITGNLIFQPSFGQSDKDLQDKLDANNFASVIEIFRENDGMLVNISTSMNHCENLLQIEYGNKTEYNEYLATCLRYSEALNTMMKTFHNSTKTDELRIMGGLGGD